MNTSALETISNHSQTKRWTGFALKGRSRPEWVSSRQPSRMRLNLARQFDSIANEIIFKFDVSADAKRRRVLLLEEPARRGGRQPEGGTSHYRDRGNPRYSFCRDRRRRHRAGGAGFSAPGNQRQAFPV